MKPTGKFSSRRSNQLCPWRPNWSPSSNQDPYSSANYRHRGHIFRVPTLYSSRHTIDSLIDRRHFISFGPALDLGQLRRNPEIPSTTEECPITDHFQSLGRQEPSSGPNLGQNQALSSHTSDQQCLPHSDRRASHYPEAILQDHACQWSQQPRHV